MAIQLAFEDTTIYHEILDRQVDALKVIMTDGELSCHVNIVCADRQDRVNRIQKQKQSPDARLAIIGGRVVPLSFKI